MLLWEISSLLHIYKCFFDVQAFLICIIINNSDIYCRYISAKTYIYLCHDPMSNATENRPYYNSTTEKQYDTKQLIFFTFREEVRLK